MGRQDIAASDLELLDELGEPVTAEDRKLALREPQLKTAKARVTFARAAVAQAELDLERTTIRAPFDLQVLERTVDVGSQVAPGDTLGRLVGVGEYWVTTTVPLPALKWIDLPGEPNADGGAPVTVRHRSAWPDGATREGTVTRRIGTLNEETRLARLLVTIEDPLALDPGNQDQPSLLLGSILQCVITGREIKDVVRLDRALLRGNDTVWVMAPDDTLRIVEAEVAFEDARYAYLSGGLEPGDRIVTTNLATVSEGAPLQVEGGAQ